MARRVVSILRRGPAALRASDPVLEANAYAVAEDVDLALVLRGAAVELAIAGGETPPTDLAGIALPPAATAQDLRGLVESGVRVYVADADLRRRGLTQTELVAGVEPVGDDDLIGLLGAADAVLNW